MSAMCEQCEKYKDAIKAFKALDEKNDQIIASYRVYVDFLEDMIKCYETLSKPKPKKPE